MKQIKQIFVSGLCSSLLLFSGASLSEALDASAKVETGDTVYRPQSRPSIDSVEVARNNLAELLSGKNGDVPGIRVPTMPATCSGTSGEALRLLGQGGPSHAAIACRQDQLLYAIYASIRVLSSGLHASNQVSVSYANLADPDLGVKEISGDSAQMDLINGPFLSAKESPDGRPISLDVGRRPFQIVLRNGVSFHFQKLENATAFADNAFFIGAAMKAAEEERTAQFNAKLAQYRAGVKPRVSEEQRRLVVQANLMRQHKNYAQAIDLFQQALDIDPVAYPDAYFNSAMLAEQLGRYAMAIDFMKKYLLLMPGSNDARQAQDKIYEWELLGEGTVKP